MDSSQAASEIDILPDDTIEWMWGDVGGLFAAKNPLRWSSAKSPLDTLSDLAKLAGNDLERPVEMFFRRAGAVSKEARFNTVVEAIAALSPQAPVPAPRASASDTSRNIPDEEDEGLEATILESKEFRGDHIETSDKRHHNAVGWLESINERGEIMVGTASIVRFTLTDDWFLLTAAHNLYNYKKGQEAMSARFYWRGGLKHIPGKSMDIEGGEETRAGKKYFSAWTFERKDWHISPEYKEQGSHSAMDIATIEIPLKLLQMVKPADICLLIDADELVRPSQMDTNVIVAGYPNEGVRVANSEKKTQKEELWESKGSIEDHGKIEGTDRRVLDEYAPKNVLRDRMLLRYKFDTLSGQSGSAVVKEAAPGQENRVVIGVHVQGFAQHANFATAIKHDVLEWLVTDVLKSEKAKRLSREGLGSIPVSDAGRATLVAADAGDELGVVGNLMAQTDIDKTIEYARYADQQGWPTIVRAACFGHAKIVELLIAARADVQIANAEGFTPINVSAQNGHVEVVQHLLTAKAEYDKPNNEGVTPVSMAAGENHIDVLKALIAAQADVNLARHDGATPFTMASQSGHYAVVQALLAAKIDVNQANGKGCTAVRLAAENDRLAVVEFLLKAKADVDRPSKDGATPVLISATYGHAEVLQQLMRAKADVNRPQHDGIAPLYMAASNGHSAVVGALSAAKADLNCGDPKSGATPLMMATQKGHDMVVQALIAAGGDTDRPDSQGSTPLSWAADLGHESIVRKLLAARADVAPRDQWGGNALKSATDQGHVAIQNLLVAAGAQQ